ncbi:MAG TPA: DUF362 domain-containing protein [Dehalococcoidia bacterium]|jgi:uncharacterized protein (DUF362 family)|nr:DUF362 domain-containing protein [Dehalococcoidia bacterium]
MPLGTTRTNPDTHSDLVNTRDGAPTVAVIKTNPATVLADVGSAMRLAKYNSQLAPDVATLLKINISWQHYYPACSTSPWQLDGVIKTLKEDGFEDLIPTHNGTVVVDAREGEVNNKHDVVVRRHGLESVYLEDVEWVPLHFSDDFLVLDQIYPDGINIPKFLIDKNVIHLPTMKTHVFTTITGAMKNAFGGLLNFQRHWTHSVIHETLVDLLRIQKKIHPGIFALTDGTFAGSGPGPRAMQWHEKNVLLAGSDQVAVDAVAAKMMGFDPMSIDFIRIADEHGLGCGQISKINIVGEDISDVNWQFQSGNTLASKGQKMIYWGNLRPLENMLLRSKLTPLAYLASNIYHNEYWLRFKGKKRINEAMKTQWGRLFLDY